MCTSQILEPWTLMWLHNHALSVPLLAADVIPVLYFQPTQCWYTASWERSEFFVLDNTGIQNIADTNKDKTTHKFMFQTRLFARFQRQKKSPHTAIRIPPCCLPRDRFYCTELIMWWFGVTLFLPPQVVPSLPLVPVSYFFSPLGWGVGHGTF